jgi:predicted acylesterase/phospholipase RssA
VIRRWLRALRGRRDDDADPPFLAGLAIGALVGAAIAGSTLWRRLRRDPDGDDDAG